MAATHKAADHWGIVFPDPRCRRFARATYEEKIVRDPLFGPMAPRSSKQSLKYGGQRALLVRTTNSLRIFTMSCLLSIMAEPPSDYRSVHLGHTPRAATCSPRLLLLIAALPAILLTTTNETHYQFHSTSTPTVCIDEFLLTAVSRFDMLSMCIDASNKRHFA